MYSEYKGERVLKTVSDGTPLCGAEGQDGLFASAVLDGDKVYVKIVNTTPGEQSISLKFNGLKRKQKIEAEKRVNLHSYDLYEDNSLDDPDAFEPYTEGFDFSDGSVAAEPYSFSIYCFRLVR